MPSLDITKVTAGFRGSFYMNGVKVAECQGWNVKRASKRTSEQVLDDIYEYSVLQSVNYTMEIDTIIIKHQMESIVVGNDAKAQDTVFNFRGEVHRADGSVGSCDMVQASPGTDFPIMGTMVGQTYKGKYSLVLNSIPTITPLT